MSESPSKPSIPLTVLADSPATEIFVIDHALRRRATGLGTLEVELPRGFYKVRFRAAGSHRDQLVELSGETGPVTIHGEAVDYESAVPIQDTSTSRETHAYPAEEISRQVHHHPGRGSRLFVFARDLNPVDPADAWRGISVWTMDGEPVAEVADGTCDPNHAFGALSLEMDPGTYRLQVDTDSYGIYEMFVVTREGWQTQVFGLAEDFVAEGRRTRRMALRSVAVLMSRDSFDHAARDVRLADMARLGLRSGRAVVSRGDLRDMLWAKYENPMMGIYGAHLLVAGQRSVDHDFLEMVIRNLTGLVGPHPDVLSLHLRPGAGTPPAELAFPEPPMLRTSWDLVLRGTRRRNSLVPRDSHSDLLADGMLTSTPWLLRRVPEVAPAAPGPETGTMSFSASKRALAHMASALRSKEVSRQLGEMSARKAGLSPLERSIVSATRAAARSEEYRAEGTSAPEIDASAVLANLEAPPSAIARSTLSTMRKLGDQGMDLGALGLDLEELS